MSPLNPYYLDVHYAPPSEFGPRPIPCQTHRMRDLYVAVSLSPELARHGYEFAGYIPELPRQLLDKMTPEQIAHSRIAFGVDSLVVYLGRTLLDDVIQFAGAPDQTIVGRKPIWPSQMPVEQAIHAAVRAILVGADRERIILSQDIPLPEDAQYLRQVFFNIYSGKKGAPASIRSARPDEGRAVLPDPAPTLGYVLGIPSVPPFGFRLLVVFGIGGTESLAFAELLRTQWSDVVGRALTSPHPYLAVARFRTPEKISMPILSYGPAELDAKLLAEIELPNLGKSAPSRARSSRRATAKAKPGVARKAPGTKGPAPEARRKKRGA